MFVDIADDATWEENEAIVFLNVPKKTRQSYFWSFEFIWTRSTNGRDLIGLFASVGGSQKRRLSDTHAAAACSGGPVPRTGPDLPRVVGRRRNSSKSRN